MLNENLFDDRKDVEIARLKKVIESFKTYDKERKQYYARKMQRLEELERLFCDGCDSDNERKLQKQVLQLKEEVKILNTVIKARKIEEERTPEELKKIVDVDFLRKQNKTLKSLVKALHATNDDLFLKVRFLEREIAGYKKNLQIERGEAK